MCPPTPGYSYYIRVQLIPSAATAAIGGHGLFVATNYSRVSHIFLIAVTVLYTVVRIIRRATKCIIYLFARLIRGTCDVLTKYYVYYMWYMLIAHDDTHCKTINIRTFKTLPIHAMSQVLESRCTDIVYMHLYIMYYSYRNIGNRLFCCSRLQVGYDRGVQPRVLRGERDGQVLQ